MSKFAHHTRAEIVTMYWSLLFFGNLDYNAELEYLTVDSLFTLTNSHVFQNMKTGFLSPLGETFESIVREACECGLEDDPFPVGSDDPDFFLATSYPNPFNTGTTIRFSLDDAFYGRTVVSVYDIQGRTVQILNDDWLFGGTHLFRFTPENMPAGIYVYRILAGEQVVSGKMLYVR